MHGIIQLNEQQETFAPVDDAPRWYALLVQSGKERKFCFWLRKRQYQPYWPRFMGVVKLNRHRKAKRWCSVIPGYLFLPDNGAINWELIEEAQGVHGFMSNASGDLVDLPYKGKQGIEQIKLIESALQESVIAATQGIPFKTGQQVWVGKLSVEGKILRIDNSRQITVEVPMFGSRVKSVMPVSELEAV